MGDTFHDDMVKDSATIRPADAPTGEFDGGREVATDRTPTWEFARSTGSGSLRLVVERQVRDQGGGALFRE